jgi:hypothetical protein
MAKDIRGDGSWQDGPKVGAPDDKLDWASRLESHGPEAVGLKTAIPITGGDHRTVINPSTGKPFGVRTNIIRNLSESDSLWQQKLVLEPCFLCEHFRPGAVTRAEKGELWKSMISEHGRTKKGMSQGLGNPDDFELCEIYMLMTHMSASCPRHWKARKTLMRIFTGLGTGRG